MDKPADPATPFAEVYQSFQDDLVKYGRKPSTIHRYRYNIVRFETWLNEKELPAILASFEQSVRGKEHDVARFSCMSQDRQPTDHIGDSLACLFEGLTSTHVRGTASSSGGSSAIVTPSCSRRWRKRSE